MPAGGAAIVGGSALLGGVMGGKGGKKQADAAETAARLQLQATRDSIAAQTKAASQGYKVFSKEAANARKYLTQQSNLARKDLLPLRDIGLQSLQTAQSYLDPNNPIYQQEQNAFSKTLAQNLSARGLTGSGAEIAGLSDFVLGQGQQRRSLALGLAGQGANTLNTLSGLRTQLGQGLAGISSNMGQSGLSLYGNLGQGIGSTLSQGGANLAQLQIAQGNAQAQSLAAYNNSLQTAGSGIGSLYYQDYARKQNQAYYQPYLSSLAGSSGGSGSSSFSPSALSLNWNNPFGGG